ncbi:hypothetical protein [Chitinimonas sp. BJYL2]|uniref:hypothetical protein n=1 Tax=Chitinimonas sp. BJYL2 TaxID=2976696 RepID=UPI0022B437CE|nr:hypothetical protein [Chitinimonas sp. BJYL2]
MTALLLLLFCLLIWPLTPALLGLLLGFSFNQRALGIQPSWQARLRWRLRRAAWLAGMPMGLLAAVYAIWWFSLDEPALLGLSLLVWAAPVPLAAALSLLWRARRAVWRHPPARPWGILIAALIVLQPPLGLGALFAMEQHFEAHAYPQAD